MPSKRPNLVNLQLNTSEKAVSITDTMTLVVKGDGGVEVRVKDSGIASSTAATADVGEYKSENSVTVNEKIRFEDLQTSRVLGKGSQGKVKLVRHVTTGKTYALKYIQFDGDTEDMREAIGSELRQVTALKHKNLVTSHEAYFREGRLYIVLEYMDAGSMADVLKRRSDGFSEEMLAYVARELLRGLEHLHSLKMIHRDIKPVNVLANSSGEVKIADFGVAKKLSDGDVGTVSTQGSVIYMSPERISGDVYSFRSDIWSVGLTLAECALGIYPYSALKDNLFDLLQAIATQTATIDWKASGRVYSPDFINFVEKCLCHEASRPSATELLQHVFVQKAECVSAAEAGKWFITKC
ncbi:Protein tyrosine kinase Protein kinase domain [Trypanosoma vivax]|nr:protein kinase [Trypanosoma vivax]KAH8616933.1 Protein tyrosine kinase Protein kinase domain [Trypanosoma vivax]